MILKFNKTLNEKNEYTLIAFDLNNSIDNITEELFIDKNLNIIENPCNYYFYIKNIVDVNNCEKFKIKAKKGDIVSLTARDNSYIVFPSKRTFSIAFNLEYSMVLKYEYQEVLFEGKPYEVTYVKDNELKVNDGVVYTLSQLVTYISLMIKSYNYRSIEKTRKHPIDIIDRVISKFYSNEANKTDKNYELNVKTIYVDKDNKYHTLHHINVSKSNKYLYDYYLIRMFAYMILTKSKSDRENNNDIQYCFNEQFDTIEDVYKFLEEHQDIVNKFFIETEMLFSKPNDMFTNYAPVINGVYMFYDYNNVKHYLYRAKDEIYFKEKSLKQTYVSTRYKHKIKGIKSIYSI